MTTATTRDRILDAAMSIVREQGVARLTLDEAARVAGVSKGGVLYHFKSKDALITGMMAVLTEKCAALHQRFLDDEPEGPNRYARAAIRAAFDPSGPGSDPVGGALLAAIVVNPELVAPMRQHMLDVLAEIKATCHDPALCMIACLAMDGLWLHGMVGQEIYGEADREEVRRKILTMLDAVDAAPAKEH